MYQISTSIIRIQLTMPCTIFAIYIGIHHLFWKNFEYNCIQLSLKTFQAKIDAFQNIQTIHLFINCLFDIGL